MKGVKQRMNYNKDYDRDHDCEDHLSKTGLKGILENSYEIESKLLRDYVSTAERIHDNKELKDRLQNFAEGNAKRSRQLLDELKTIK
jgi:hypothetical protein